MHEAKTRLSQLVAEVEAGGEVVITRRGEEVARLVRAVPERPDRGRGSMRGTGNHAGWDVFTAGEGEIEQIFGLGEQ